MNRFEFFESGEGLKAVRLGLISISLLVYYDIYKRFLERRSKIVRKKKTAFQIRQEVSKIKLEICDECKCSYATVVRSIFFFEPCVKKLRRKKTFFQKTENAFTPV